MKTNLRLMFALACCAGGGIANAQVASGDYYLYDAASKFFLSRGANWGTEATVDKYGLAVHYAAAEGYINFFDWSGTRMFSDDGNSIYTDGGTDKKKSTFAFKEVDGGYVLQLTKKADETDLSDTYVRHDLGDYGEYVHTTTDLSQATVWALKTKAERDAIIAAYADDNKKNVTAKAGVTFTGSFEDYLTTNYKAVDNSSINNTGFTWTKIRQDNNPNTTAVESYQSTGSWTQSISGLPQGIYKVTFHGLDRYGSNGDMVTQGNSGYENVTTFMRANDEDVQFPSWYSERVGDADPNSVSQAQSAFNSGKYEKSVYTYVGEDGKLDLSVNIPSHKGMHWVIFNNWSLTYYDNSMSAEEVSTLLTEAREVAEKPMETTTLTALNAAVQQLEGASTIANYNSLFTALAAAKASADAYASAKTKIDAANTLMSKNTFVTAAAKTEYNKVYSDAQTKLDASSLTTAEAAALVNPYTITGWRAANIVDDYLISPWGVAPETWADMHVNTWSNEGVSDGTEFKVPFFEYWVSDGNVLGAKSMTATLAAADGIKAGQLYKVSLWARTRQTNSKTADLSKITFNVNGGTAAQMAAEQSTTGNNVFALKNVTVYGYADADANLKLNINVADGSNVSWLSWQNVTFEKAEPVVLDEASKEDITAPETAPVLLKRTFAAGAWNTLVLPFSLTAEQVKAAFGEDTRLVAFADDAADDALVHFKETESIEANVPVLVKTSTQNSEFTFNDVTVNVAEPVAKGENGNWNFVGTYKAATAVPASNYELYNNKWYLSKGTSNYVVNGFRAFLAPASAAAAAKSLTVEIGGTPTAVDSIVADVTEDGEIYNISGQRIGSMQKGINIKNGKKILVK